MFVFFLIIHLILAVIFFFFKDISGRYYESVFFLISGLLFFYYFSPFYIIGSSEKSEKQSKFLAFLDKEKLKNIIPKSRKLLYSGAVVLFYLSIFGIFYSFSLPFDYFIVGISTLALLLFVTSKFYFPKEVIALAFRTNTLAFSVYSFVGMIHFFIQPGEITWMFLFENFLFLVSGVLILLWDSYISQNFKNTIYSYYLWYFFVSALFYLNTFLISDINTASVLLGTVLSVIYFEYLSKIPGFKKFDIVTKYFWLFLSYITILYLGTLIVFFRPYFSFDIIGLLLIWSAFQYYVHKKFENYLSYLFTIAVVVLVYCKIFMLYEVESFFFYFLFTFILPGIFVGYTFVIKNIHQYDYYLLYIAMILFSIGGIITYFYHFSFSIDSILPGSVFLLLESGLFFVSFVRLKK